MFRLRHLALGVFHSRVLYPSPYINRSKEVKDRGTALIGERVTELEPIFSSTNLRSHCRPQHHLRGPQWRQFLKRSLRVWVRYGRYQHLAVGLLFVHLTYRNNDRPSIGRTLLPAACCSSHEPVPASGAFPCRQCRLFF
jgi:hypothetical protein